VHEQYINEARGETKEVTYYNTIIGKEKQGRSRLEDPEQMTSPTIPFSVSLSATNDIKSEERPRPLRPAVPKDEDGGDVEIA